MTLGGIGVTRRGSGVHRPQSCPLLFDRTAERQQGATPLAGSAIFGIEHFFCQCLKRGQGAVGPVC